MSTAMFPGLPSLLARRFSAGGVRIEAGGPFPTRLAGKGPLQKKAPGVARNPLKRLISDERIQGIPSKSNPPKPGNSRSPVA